MVEKSGNFSFKGWGFGKWLDKNKGSLKIVLALLLGLIGTSFGDSVFMATLFGSASSVGTKIVLDTFDFFVSEITI